MQAAGIEAFGAEVRILDLPAPAPPAPDEVVISVHAAGVGNWDEIVRVGEWDVGRRPPLALGLEAAGVRGYGAHVVLDYHDPDWPARVRDASPGGHGVRAAVNVARGGAATALQAVAGGGRLATITGDPPSPERGVEVADVYIRADGTRLAALVAALAEGLLSLHVAATLPLADAATALQGATTGRAAGATVLTLEATSIEAAAR